MVVDAYNEDVPVAFYKKNGFDFMFSTEEQEKSYFLGGFEKKAYFCGRVKRLKGEDYNE